MPTVVVNAQTGRAYTDSDLVALRISLYLLSQDLRVAGSHAATRLRLTKLIADVATANGLDPDRLEDRVAARIDELARPASFSTALPLPKETTPLRPGAR